MILDDSDDKFNIYLLSLSAIFTITKKRKFHRISCRIQEKILFKHSLADRNSRFLP